MVTKDRACALVHTTALLAATLSLAACATGSGINVAGSGGDPSFSEESLDDQVAQGEPIYLAASGNVMLSWRDPSALTSPGLGGTVAGLVGRSPGAPGAGGDLQTPLSPQAAATALGASTPLGNLNAQAVLGSGAATAGLGVTTPVAGVNTQANLSPGAVTAGTALATPVAGAQLGAVLSPQAVGAGLTVTSPVAGLTTTVNAGQPLGGLGAVTRSPTTVAGPVTALVTNPNTTTGALLTNLSGAAMQMGPPASMTAPMVPSSQNLGAVLGLLKRPGA